MSGITLLRGEELKMQLKPHMFSFFHLYLTFFLLLIWSYVIYDFFNSDKFSDFPFYDSIEALVQDSEVLAGAIIWSFGLFLVGFIARYFFLDSGGQGIFRLYSGVALFGIIVMAYHAYSDMADTMSFGRWFIPSLTAVVGLNVVIKQPDLEVKDTDISFSHSSAWINSRGDSQRVTITAVSYTHLTLPTSG